MIRGPAESAIAVLAVQRIASRVSTTSVPLTTKKTALPAIKGIAQRVGERVDTIWRKARMRETQ